MVFIKYCFLFFPQVFKEIFEHQKILLERIHVDSECTRGRKRKYGEIVRADSKGSSLFRTSGRNETGSSKKRHLNESIEAEEVEKAFDLLKVCLLQEPPKHVDIIKSSLDHLKELL